jgi:hypothetical protein
MKMWEENKVQLARCGLQWHRSQGGAVAKRRTTLTKMYNEKTAS